jgi:hypothetical protein
MSEFDKYMCTVLTEMSNDSMNKCIKSIIDSMKLKSLKLTEEEYKILSDLNINESNYFTVSIEEKAFFITKAYELFNGFYTEKLRSDYEISMTTIPKSTVDTMLYINISINDKIYQAFIDTGSAVTIMSKKVMFENGLEDRLNKKYKIKAIGIGVGRGLGVIYNMAFGVGSKVVTWNFNVMEHCPDILIGLDFLNTYCKNINFIDKTITIDTSIIPLLDKNDVIDESSILHKANVISDEHKISLSEAISKLNKKEEVKKSSLDIHEYTYNEEELLQKAIEASMKEVSVSS